MATPAAPARAPAAAGGSDGGNGPQLQQEQLQSQSAITAYDNMLQDKERVIRESIAKKFRNIHAVERQLADLQMALHVNVGPRRQALEHLRSKIEEQNTKIDFHRSAFRKAKAAMEEAQRHLEAEERVKQQLGLELNMLVQESSTAQLKKLEELSRELEHLTDGAQSEQTANGSSGSCGAARQGGGDAVVAARAQQTDTAAAPPGRTSGQDAEQQAPTQQQQQQQHHRQQQQQAAEARGRHVQLSGQRQTRIPTPPADGPRGSSEPFQGF